MSDDSLHNAPATPSGSAPAIREVWRRRWHGPVVVLSALAAAIALAMPGFVHPGPAEVFEGLRNMYERERYPQFLRLADRFQERYADRDALPQRPELYFLQGRAAETLYREGQGDHFAGRASEYYRLALAESEDDTERALKAKEFIAGQAKLDGRYGEAAVVFRDVADASPAHRLRVLPELIDSLRRSGQLAAAIEAMDEYLALDAPAPPAEAQAGMMRLKALTLRDKGRPGEAMTLWREVLAHFDAYPRRGAVLCDMGDTLMTDDASAATIRQARALFEEAAELEGKHRPYALFRRAVSAERLALGVLEAEGRTAAQPLLTQAAEEYAEGFGQHRDSPYAALSGAHLARITLMQGNEPGAQAVIAELLNSGMLDDTGGTVRQAAERTQKMAMDLIGEHLHHRRFPQAGAVIELLKRLASEYDVLRQQARLALAQAEAIEASLETHADALTASKRDALAHSRDRYLAGAADYYARAAERTSDVLQRVEALAEAGDIRFRAGQWIQARAHYRRYLDTAHEPLVGGDPRAFEVRYRLGECEFRLHNYLGAIEALKHNVALRPTLLPSYASHTLIGQCLMALRRYDDARRIFHDVRMGTRAATEEILDIAMAPRGDDDVRLTTGNRLWLEALVGQAEAEYFHYQHLDPEKKRTPDIARPLLTDAKLHLDEAIQRLPNDARVPRLHYYLAVTSHRLGRLDGEAGVDTILHAANRYRQVIEAGPSAELPEQIVKFAHFELGDAYADAGRYAEAIDAYRQAHDRYLGDPAAVASRFKIARCYRKLGRPADADAELEKARLDLERLEERQAARPHDDAAPSDGGRWEFQERFWRAALEWDAAQAQPAGR